MQNETLPKTKTIKNKSAEKMDGWTNGWMDGWMDEWMDGWLD